MKKIVSVLLIIAVMLLAVSCGSIENYNDIVKKLEKEAESFNSFDDAEIAKWEDIYGGETKQFYDSIVNMCYARMSDGTKVRCVEFSMDVYANIYSKKVTDSKVVIFKNTIVLHGNADIIDTFAETEAE